MMYVKFGISWFLLVGRNNSYFISFSNACWYNVSTGSWVLIIHVLYS